MAAPLPDVQRLKILLRFRRSSWRSPAQPMLLPQLLAQSVQTRLVRWPWLSRREDMFLLKNLGMMRRFPGGSALAFALPR